ncbi:glycoside hydrolase [Powellomyces hirtus]|nr:glycoside hydrolase [Powellomyces hirtus]
MSLEPLSIDIRTRRNWEDDFTPSPSHERKVRPDRPYVASIQWGGADDADAAWTKYNKAAPQRSELGRRIVLYVLIASLVGLGLWEFARPLATSVESAPAETAKPAAAITKSGAATVRKVNDTVWDARAENVAEAFRHAWKGYETHAWGYDELKPITHSHSTWMNVGMTIIDSLDTALVMNEAQIFDKALKWVMEDLKFDYDGDSNVFELTIRVLGGLLSAYQLTNAKHPPLLKRAQELADILLLAFDTPSKLPLESVNFATGKPRAANGGAGPGSTAEITTLSLEFKYLSFLTGNKKYWNAVQEIGKVISKIPKPDGLVPIYVNTDTAEWANREIRLGSRGDSYYGKAILSGLSHSQRKVLIVLSCAEYLGKQYLLTNEKVYLDEYRAAITGIRKHLLGLSNPHQFFFIGELPSGVLTPPSRDLHPKMDHLVCFLPGTLALIATRGKLTATMSERLALDHVDLLDLELAEELGTSCWQMYSQTLTGLAPEIVYWRAQNQQQFNEKTQTLAERELKRHQTGTASPRPTHVSRYLNSSLSITENIPISDLNPLAAAIRPMKLGGPVEQDFAIHAQDGHNLLRPETIESFFVLYRVTGNPIWRERGWEMFQGFERWCRVEEGGYTSLNNVRVKPPTPRDKMETFFLGETLKYFYLLFASPPSPGDEDDGRRLIDLENYVLNTEAHPFPKFTAPSGFL